MDELLAPGIEGKMEVMVTPEKTATSYCSGTLDIFATPSMIACMEQTAMDSVAPLLPEMYTTVGTEVSVKHFKATLPGSVVKFNSKLVKAENMKLLFEVSASSGDDLIGKGIHARYIVDKQKFIENLLKK
jgi:fluoroacetyl-CoA thioesterase